MNKWVIGFLIGHGGALIFPRLPNSFELAVIIATIGVLIKLNYKFVSSILFGLFIQQVFSIWQHQPSLLSQHLNTGKPVPITAKVIAPVVATNIHEGRLANILMAVKTVNDFPAGMFQMEVKVLVSFYAKSVPEADVIKSIKQGNMVAINVKFKSISGYENDFGFNKQRHYYSLGIAALGSARVSDILVIGHDINTQQQVIDNYLQFISTDLLNVAYIGASLALITGDKSLLRHPERKMISQLGLSHLLAISGLHIGLIYLLFFQLSKWLPYQVLTSLLPVILIWLFVVMIGQPPAAERAAMAISLFVVVRQFWASLKTIDTILIVMLISVIAEPRSWLMFSWWLSFYAVIGIIIFSQSNQLSQFEWSKKAIITKVTTAIHFQVFITIWMIPILIVFFGGQNLAAVISNLLFLPVFLVLIIPIAVILGLTITFDSPLFVVINQTLILFISSLFKASFDFFTSLHLVSFWKPMSDFELVTIMMLLAMLPLFVLQAFNMQRTFKNLRLIKNEISKRGAPVASLWSISLLPITLLVLITLTKWRFQIDSGKTENFKFYVYDVGQGSANALISVDHGFLFDLGPVYKGGFNATESVVIPNLNGLGVTQLTSTTLSHLDADHRGNAKAILEKYPNSQNYNCSKNLRLPRYEKTGGLKIETLWPKADMSFVVDESSKSRNDKSCVTKITNNSNGNRLLISGDISKRVERLLVDMHYKGEIDLSSEILLSPHHGSKHSSTLPFIFAVKPSVVVHSAGVNNRFGFPATEVVARYERYKIDQYSTSEAGMITIQLAEPAVKNAVSTKLNSASPFWKRQNPFSIQAQIR